MLKVCLLVVEDEHPEKIYETLHSELSGWVFVRKGLVQLERPERDDHRWVTNLQDWRRAVHELASDDRLVFCTVDLKIPDQPGGVASSRNGIRIVHEVKAGDRNRLSCCILTGLDSASLEDLANEERIPDVPFEFKSDLQGRGNVVSYIKSQVLRELPRVSFVDSSGTERRVLIRDSTELRDHFLSKAAYYADSKTWHVPTILVGGAGLGRRSLVEFTAHLADAQVKVVDLSLTGAKANRENFKLVEEYRSRLAAAGSAGADDHRRALYYVRAIDGYRPGEGDPEQNCLSSLALAIRALRALPAEARVTFGAGLFLGVSGASQLAIRSRDARWLIRDIEEAIGELAGFPVHPLNRNENGWVIDHPRILHLASMERRGRRFIEGVISSRLESLSASQPAQGKQGQAVDLARDVRDLLTDKTDWSLHENLRGLYRVLDGAYENFARDSPAAQRTITRSHLAEDARGWLARSVISLDDVHVELSDVSGAKQVVVEHADFKVEEGELLVILGPSGCGKSTVLRLVAGLLRPTSGAVLHRGDPVTAPSAKIGFIFQDYSLFPWLTVRENIEFGPRKRGVARDRYLPEVERLLRIAHLRDAQQKYPRELSGGMQQRVAIVRSLANEPEVLLMDEPFSALDVQTRWEMQDFLLSTKRLTAKTVVFVTHDIDEAVYVGDRIYVASPRPMRLAAHFVVPFSEDVRRAEIRADPTFVALVGKVRDSLVRAARERDETASAPSTRV